MKANKTKSRNAAITREVGDWLNIFPWEFFVTLTYARDDMSVFLAERCFNRYLNEYPASVIYFYVFEMHSLRVSPHVHLLIGEVGGIKPWKHGMAKVLPYDPGLGANFYIAKHITSSNVWWDIQARLDE